MIPGCSECKHTAITGGTEDKEAHAATYRDLERGGPAVVQHGAVLGVLQLIVDGERHWLHIVCCVLRQTESIFEKDRASARGGEALESKVRQNCRNV